jgi:hypothetical protein
MGRCDQFCGGRGCSQCRTLAGEMITAAEAKNRLSGGGSFEVTRENFAQTATGLGLNAGAIEALLKKGLSFEQAILYVKHPDWPLPE